MTVAERRWRIRLAAAAETDFRSILAWIAKNFGQAQARFYAETLSLALEELAAGPNVPGSRKRDHVAKGLMTLHAARKGRSARHFVLYRIGEDEDKSVIDILRLLHDSMELARHIRTE